MLQASFVYSNPIINLFLKEAILIMDNGIRNCDLGARVYFWHFILEADPEGLWSVGIELHQLV